MILKKLTKLLMLAALAVCLALPIQASAASVGIGVKTASSDLMFDGNKLKLPRDQYLFIVNGTSYVPLRFVSYALMKSVVWDNKTSTVTVKAPSKVEETTLHDYLINAIAAKGEASAKAGVTVKIVKKQVKFVFDGQAKMLPAGQFGYILNGTLYVPVRFMSEATGSVIKWDPVTKQITGESKAYAAVGGSQSTGTDGQGGNTTDQGSATAEQGQAGTSGGNSAKPARASIEAGAEQRLTTLRLACQNDLLTIYSGYLSAETDAGKQSYKARGQAKIDACRASFNSIVDETEADLIANGYSTEKIPAYRQQFEDDLAAAKQAYASST